MVELRMCKLTTIIAKRRTHALACSDTYGHVQSWTVGIKVVPLVWKLTLTKPRVQANLA